MKRSVGLACGWVWLVAGWALAALPVWEEGEREALAEVEEVPGGFFAGLLEGDGEPLFPEAAVFAEGGGRAGEVPEEFLDGYFAERPSGRLLDPQGLLEPGDFENQAEFLEYHAEDSMVDLWVYLFGGGQEIPGEVREEELIERCFSGGRPAVVVMYHFGEPERTVMYLSDSLTERVPAAEQRRALESAVMMAARQDTPGEELEAFAVQLSTRIFWMERMVGGDAADEVPEETAGRELADGGREEAAPEAAAGVDWRQVAGPWVLPGMVALGVVAAAAGGWLWQRRRVRRVFPEIEVEPRLGGAHAAGIGAVISFASAAVPPSSQRDQVPDYLRRARG